MNNTVIVGVFDEIYTQRMMWRVVEFNKQTCERLNTKTITMKTTITMITKKVATTRRKIFV